MLIHKLFTLFVKKKRFHHLFLAGVESWEQREVEIADYRFNGGNSLRVFRWCR